jgi:hypothetical protein
MQVLAMYSEPGRVRVSGSPLGSVDDQPPGFVARPVFRAEPVRLVIRERFVIENHQTPVLLRQDGFSEDCIHGGPKDQNPAGGMVSETVFSSRHFDVHGWFGKGK